jgi:trimethylamine:corrinoid methyltransferase-like protein
MGHRSTLEWYKDVYWFPELWDRRPLAQGKWEGLEPARQRARQIAREAGEGTGFELPTDKSAALLEIYRAAEKTYAG